MLSSFLHKALSKFSTQYPKNLDLKSSGSTFYVNLTTIRPINWLNSIERNFYLCLISIIRLQCPLENFIQIIWSQSTMTYTVVGENQNSSLTIAFLYHLLLQVCIMVFNATKALKLIKTKKDKLDYSDLNATLIVLNSLQLELQCQILMVMNSLNWLINL